MSSATRTQALPTLPGISKEAADQIRMLVGTVQRLQSRISAQEKAGYLTKQAADTLYSPPVMAKELSANGSAPLNVVTSSGRTFLQPQPVKGRS